MSVLAPVKKLKSKVHYSEYIKTEDKPAEETKPAEEETIPSEAPQPSKPENRV